MSYNQGKSGGTMGAQSGAKTWQISDVRSELRIAVPGEMDVFKFEFLPPPAAAPPLFVYRRVANLISEWQRLECKTNMTT